jgi:hypothetical protein
MTGGSGGRGGNGRPGSPGERGQDGAAAEMGKDVTMVLQSFSGNNLTVGGAVSATFSFLNPEGLVLVDSKGGDGGNGGLGNFFFHFFFSSL